jgi:hypothetical protein
MVILDLRFERGDGRWGVGSGEWEVGNVDDELRLGEETKRLVPILFSIFQI